MCELKTEDQCTNVSRIPQHSIAPADGAGGQKLSALSFAQRRYHSAPTAVVTPAAATKLPLTASPRCAASADEVRERDQDRPSLRWSRPGNAESSCLIVTLGAGPRGSA
jgi:hypothetical protein